MGEVVQSAPCSRTGTSLVTSIAAGGGVPVSISRSPKTILRYKKPYEVEVRD